MRVEYKEELNKILDYLGGELDISETAYKTAVRSYNVVGELLSNSEKLKKYNPEILPQGSFMLGTMIKPISDSDDLDIDLVCQLDGKPIMWAQKDLKEAVGDVLKDSRYGVMLKEYEGGRRCWTILYAEGSNYHMDILPSIVSENQNVYLAKSFSINEELNLEPLAIRITDKERSDYGTEIDSDYWYKSNPFGYAQWFFQRAMVDRRKMFALNEAVNPVREYEKNKLPLQRVVQILKRHRDIMFDDDQYNSDNKPISIIITTLAARSYNKSENITDALLNAVSRMRDHIETRWNSEESRYEKWIENPVNNEENFADKWIEESQKESYFYMWLDKLETDIRTLTNSESVGLPRLQESFSAQFGENLSKRVFTNYGVGDRILREEGKQRMATGTGMLGSTGIGVRDHEFRGNK